MLPLQVRWLRFIFTEYLQLSVKIEFLENHKIILRGDPHKISSIISQPLWLDNLIHRHRSDASPKVSKKRNNSK